MHHGDGVDISFFEFDCSKVRGQAKVSKVSNAMQLAFIYFGQNLNNRPTEARIAGWNYCLSTKTICMKIPTLACNW